MFETIDTPLADQILTDIAAGRARPTPAVGDMPQMRVCPKCQKWLWGVSWLCDEEPCGEIERFESLEKEEPGGNPAQERKEQPSNERSLTTLYDEPDTQSTQTDKQDAPATVRNGENTMNLKDAFPSNWLKASDLKGRRVSVTIESCEFETVGTDSKPVLRFRNVDKGLVLNRTKAAMLEAICETDDTTKFIGKQLVLYPTKVNFQGEMRDAIGIDFPVSQNIAEGL
jgi:hypothetical protein